MRALLEQPRKLEAELAYLERLQADAGEQPGIARRIENLRARLSDPGRMRRIIGEELRERLAQAAAEAQIAAAEQQVLECYRARLAVVAGPLPPDLVLDEDLLNATLLTVDIEKNRRLPRRLLRAHLAGEQHWREKHPGNAAFLEAGSPGG